MDPPRRLRARMCVWPRWVRGTALDRLVVSARVQKHVGFARTWPQPPSRKQRAAVHQFPACASARATGCRKRCTTPAPREPYTTERCCAGRGAPNTRGALCGAVLHALPRVGVLLQGAQDCRDAVENKDPHVERMLHFAQVEAGLPPQLFLEQTPVPLRQLLLAVRSRGQTDEVCTAVEPLENVADAMARGLPTLIAAKGACTCACVCP